MLDIGAEATDAGSDHLTGFRVAAKLAGQRQQAQRRL